MVSVDDDIDRVVLIVGLLEVLDEGIVGLESRLLGLLLVQVDDIALYQLGEVDLLLAIHILLAHVLFHVLLVHAWLLNVHHFLSSKYFYNC